MSIIVESKLNASSIVAAGKGIGLIGATPGANQIKYGAGGGAISHMVGPSDAVLKLEGDLGAALTTSAGVGSTYLGAGGTLAWIVTPSGQHFYPALDATYDIGLSSNKVRIGYFGTVRSAAVQAPAATALNLGGGAASQISIATSGTLSWAGSLGSIQHILGPTDQNLTIKGADGAAGGKRIDLLAGDYTPGGRVGGAISIYGGTLTTGGQVDIVSGSGSGGSSGTLRVTGGDTSNGACVVMIPGSVGNGNVQISPGTLATLSGTYNAVVYTQTLRDFGSNSSTDVRTLYLNPTINYTGASRSGSVTGLQVDFVETSLPTGTNYLIRTRVGASGTTDAFGVLNTGQIKWGTGLGAINHITGPTDVALRITTGASGINLIIQPANDSSAVIGGHNYTATSSTIVGTYLSNGTYGDGGSNSTTIAQTVKIDPEINFTGATRTGYYEALVINPGETSAPTGANKLLALRVSNVDKLLVSSGGKVTNYAGVATEGLGLPAVYKSNNITAQTTNATITSYTVGAADADFEVAATVNVSAATSISTAVEVVYTDVSGASQTLTLPVQKAGGTGGTYLANGLIVSTGDHMTPSHQIRCQAATTITVRTATGTFTGVTYSASAAIKGVSGF